ncbi:hypothetical protein CHARACLAT_019797, partial [Characodon lateralis]|nr:hypothetical protein [Characodon lateralis]
HRALARRDGRFLTQCGVVQTGACRNSLVMLTLASKLKKEDGGKTGRASGASDSTHRVSIRDRLLTKEVAELEANLPSTCKASFPDENKLHHFQLAVSPAAFQAKWATYRVVYNTNTAVWNYTGLWRPSYLSLPVPHLHRETITQSKPSVTFSITCI